LSAGLGTRQRRLINEMTRHAGTYPAAWRITHADRQAFESLAKRGIVERVTVENPDKGPVETYRLAEKNLAGEHNDAKVAEFIDSLNSAIVSINMFQQALEDVVAKARRLN
jgi:hypothetical protein